MGIAEYVLQKKEKTLPENILLKVGYSLCEVIILH